MRPCIDGGIARGRLPLRGRRVPQLQVPMRPPPPVPYRSGGIHSCEFVATPWQAATPHLAPPWQWELPWGWAVSGCAWWRRAEWTAEAHTNDPEWRGAQRLRCRAADRRLPPADGPALDRPPGIVRACAPQAWSGEVGAEADVAGGGGPEESTATASNDEVARIASRVRSFEGRSTAASGTRHSVV